MTTTQEFVGNKLTATLEKLPYCMIRFKVRVEPSRSKEFRTRAIKAVNKEVSVPGFRPGKAPDALIEKQYGKSLEQEYRHIASNSVVAEIIQLSKYYPLQEKKGVSLDKFESHQEGLEIVFHYETFPEVPDVNLDNLQLPEPVPQETKEEEIDRTIKEIQLYHAKWEEVVDRVVQEGDFVVIDIDVLEEPKFRAYDNSRFHVIEKGMPEWARKLVIGLSRGDSVEGVSESGENEKEGYIPRRCLITVNLIQSAELPEVNDELAKKAGVQTVEELRSRVRQQIEAKKKEELHHDYRERVRTFLVQHYPFDLPKTDLKNIEDDCRRILERDKGHLITDKEAQAYEQKLFKSAADSIRLSYLLPHIAEQLQVPRPEETETRRRMFEMLTHHYLKTQEQLPQEQYAQLYSRVGFELHMENTLNKIIEINLGHQL
jgi:trigger factor